MCSHEDWREEPAWAGLGVGWGQASVWGNGGPVRGTNCGEAASSPGQTDLGKKASLTGQASACVCVHDINIIIKIL